jgi:hypothetical protein
MGIRDVLGAGLSRLRPARPAAAAPPARAESSAGPPAPEPAGIPTHPRAPPQTSARQAQLTQTYLASQPTQEALYPALGPQPLKDFVGARIAGHSAELMAYFLLKASLHEKPTGRAAQLLRQGQAAIDATRKKLPYGRGNVGTDILDTAGESEMRRIIAREITNKLSSKEFMGENSNNNRIPIKLAIAEFMQAGSCSEISLMVAKYLVEKHYSEKNTIRRINNPEIDHTWTEITEENSRAKDGLHVVADGWTDGPAVLSEDYFFERNKATPSKYKTNTLTSSDIEYVNLILVKLRDKFNQKNIINNLFLNMDSLDFVYTKKPIPSIKKSLAEKAPRQHVDELKTQIQAVGVLRDTDDASARMAVRDAIAWVPELVDATAQLRARVQEQALSYEPKPDNELLLMSGEDIARVQQLIKQRRAHILAESPERPKASEG